MKLELTTNPSKNDAKAISDGIINFNRHTVGLEPYDDEIKFSIFVKDNGLVVAGLRAVCYWNTLHIELLWLDESCRGQGIGEKVIKQTEEFVKGKALRNPLLKPQAGRLSLFMKSWVINCNTV